MSSNIFHQFLNFCIAEIAPCDVKVFVKQVKVELLRAALCSYLRVVIVKLWKHKKVNKNFHVFFANFDMILKSTMSTMLQN